MTNRSVDLTDPIALEIMWQRLIAIMNEVDDVIVKTTFSTILSEGRDIACILTDTRGRSLCQSVWSTATWSHSRSTTSMTWLEPETYEVIDRLEQVHVVAPTAWTMSPSRSLAATASSDGFVKVWNVVERRQVDELYFEGGASGVAFASEDELLVATDRGIFHKMR